MGERLHVCARRAMSGRASFRSWERSLRPEALPDTCAVLLTTAKVKQNRHRRCEPLKTLSLGGGGGFFFFLVFLRGLGMGKALRNQGTAKRDQRNHHYVSLNNGLMCAIRKRTLNLWTSCCQNRWFELRALQVRCRAMGSQGYGDGNAAEFNPD